MIDNKKEIVLQIVFHTVLYMVVEIIPLYLHKVTILVIFIGRHPNGLQLDITRDRISVSFKK